MLIIRETFVAKPGMASKLAKLFKDSVGLISDKSRVRVLTDFVANFNTVVIETEVDSMSDYEERMREYMKNKDMGDKMAGYTEMYQTGKREIWRVW